MLKVHLDMAERHVLDGERHIARQRKIVAELERDGHDSDHATGCCVRSSRLKLSTLPIATAGGRCSRPFTAAVEQSPDR
jgi:hypothetical protein